MERDNPGSTRGGGIEAPDAQHDPTAHLGSSMRTGGAEGFVGDGLSWQAPTLVVQTTSGPTRRLRVGQQFVPTVIYGSIWYVLAIFIVLVILALNFPAPLEKPADPLNRSYYQPRPEWYFLSLFQVLKIFQGPLELVGTVVLPGIVTMILIALPFYDRNWHKRPGRRPVAMTLATVFMLSLFYLTWWSQGSHLPFSGQTSSPVAAPGAGGAGGAPAASGASYQAVYQIFANNCQQCHFNGGSAAGIINLQKYGELLKSGHPGGPWPGPVVVAGNSKKSYLWQVIVGQQQPAMPLGGAKLAQGDIDTIAKWIDAGAKEK